MEPTGSRRGVSHLSSEGCLRLVVALSLLAVCACSAEQEGVGTISIKGGGNNSPSDAAADAGQDSMDPPDSLQTDSASPASDASTTGVDASSLDGATAPDATADDGAGQADASMPPDDCDTDGDCGVWGMVCDLDVPGGACVACNYGSDCKGLFAICSAGMCVNQPPCGQDAPCKAVGQVCDTLSGHCVACLADKDCGNGWLCKAHTCIPPPTTCQSSKSCASLGQVCDKPASACVDCLDDADCAAKEFCLQGVCLADVCKPDLVQCATGDSLQTCDAAGSGWAVQPCGGGKGCHQGVCAPVVCTGGATQCDPASKEPGGAVLTCLATGIGWSAPAKCADGTLCFDGGCKPLVCTPGASKCDPGGPAKCAKDGTEWQVDTCPVGKTCGVAGGIALCLGQLCKPKTTSCEAGKAWLCADDGMSKNVSEDCGNKGLMCADGACVAESCKSGEASCKGIQLAVCDASGKAWILQSCTDGKVCKAGACAEPGPCTHTLKAESQSAKADIIVVIDTTGSMKEEFKQVNAALGALGQALKDGAVDHRVVVIGSDTGCCKICVPPPLGKANCGAGPNLKRVVAYTQGGTQLKVIIDNWGNYKSFLRADAERHIIVISDDDSDESADWFKASIAKLPAPGFAKGFVLHAIVSMSDKPDKGCDSADDPSKVAVQLATETGGHKHPVCETSGVVWQGWFKAIAGDIAKGGVACTYALVAAMKALPDLAKSLKITALIGGNKTTLAPLGAGKTCGPALEYELLGKPPVALTLCPSSCGLVKGDPLTAEHKCP